jgi:dipeptidase E
VAAEGGIVRLYLSSFGLGNRPEALKALLRGKTRVAVVLNAKDASSPENRWGSLQRELDALAGLGLQPGELDLRDFFHRPHELRAALSEFDLIWVRGGNTFVLRRALSCSGADTILPELLREDALVYGGFSAAVAVLAPSLRGLEIVDGPDVVPEGYEAEPIWEGLGLLPYAVAPHYRSDHPESEAVERLVQHFIDRHLLFRAIRDGQAIVIDGDREEVVGILESE